MASLLLPYLLMMICKRYPNADAMVEVHFFREYSSVDKVLYGGVKSQGCKSVISDGALGHLLHSRWSSLFSDDCGEMGRVEKNLSDGVSF